MIRGNANLVGLRRAALALLCLVLMTTLALGEAEVSNDPFPIKRLVIPAARLAQEQERLRQGVLLQMPLKEFEDLVAKAGRAKKDARQTPILVRSTYAA